MKAASLLLTLVIISGAIVPQAAVAQRKVLVSRYLKGPVPLDPEAKAWARIPAVEVTMLAQAIARPFNLTPSIRSLEVKSVHNGSWIAFFIAWKDATKDTLMFTDKFRDAVAVQVPIGGPTDITMGRPDARVLILHWKADWQEDIDKTFQDIDELYPNFWIDWYPFAVGEPPYEITRWTNIEAERYLTGWILGNPRSQPIKRVSVEEQIAEGFSTLTTSIKQNSLGKGVYATGSWKVVIARPLAAGDPGDPNWGPGKNTTVAFAAWDGDKGEIGSRKSFSDWLTLRVTVVRP